MSALSDPTPRGSTRSSTPLEERLPSRERTPLGLVSRRPRQLGNTPFVIGLGSLLILGLLGVLLLNTSLQNQAFRASELKRQAAEMTYAEGELRDRVTQVSSTRELTKRASELGMRPNNLASFVILPEGKITGEARTADPNFLPSAVYRSAEDQAKLDADQARQRAQARFDTEQQAVANNRQQVLEAKAKAAAQQAQRGGAAPQNQQGQQNQQGTQNNQQNQNPTQGRR